ncbi:unnamed protein product [Bursaphelenchus xylophilus]|uniref:(pine wood nematode) hypothetical protein n=1 Tax=Bursaphelenchus xylophilus TaxID=6326 RepID=A0A1I7RYA1_BURXY|nr:unnamed protein product [Bursaphelenchus xylophilus]CAG9085502.1 unnamed protein product [Bursaphelenchus xylophilus]
MLICEDLSDGKERIPLRVVNNYDGKLFPKFEYITTSVYRDPIMPISSVIHGPSSSNDNADNAIAGQFRFEVYCKATDFWGVRALEEIPRGQLVGEYVGNISRTQLQTEHDNYIFSFTDKNGVNWDVDAHKMGNFTRFMNHSCDQNVDSNVTEDTFPPRILFYSNRRIRINEELTIDYGHEWWTAKEDLKCIWLLSRQLEASVTLSNCSITLTV